MQKDVAYKNALNVPKVLSLQATDRMGFVVHLHNTLVESGKISPNYYKSWQIIAGSQRADIEKQ